MTRVKHDSSDAAMTHVTTIFEGHSLTSYLFRGRLCWIAQDAGRVVGYTNEGFQAALSNWDEELLDGSDYKVLRGADLREFKALLDVTVKVTVSRAPALKVLFESGLHLICQKTHLPLGVKLRRHLAQEVLPRLVRGEPILPAATSAGLAPEQLIEMVTVIVRETMVPLTKQVEHMIAVVRRLEERASKIHDEDLTAPHSQECAKIVSMRNDAIRLYAAAHGKSKLSASRTIMNTAFHGWNGKNCTLDNIPSILMPGIKRALQGSIADSTKKISAGTPTHGLRASDILTGQIGLFSLVPPHTN